MNSMLPIALTLGVIASMLFGYAKYLERMLRLERNRLEKKEETAKFLESRLSSLDQEVTNLRNENLSLKTLLDVYKDKNAGIKPKKDDSLIWTSKDKHEKRIGC